MILNRCFFQSDLTFSSPFNVHPNSHYVLIDNKVELKIGFRSMHLGSAEGELQAIFETGWSKS